MKQRNSLILVITLIFISFFGFLYLNKGMTPKMMSHAPNKESVFSSSTDSLPDAKASETVSLKNGDTYTMTASIVKKKIANQTVKMLAYNGSVPGPLIKVAKGSQITLNLKNETDVETTLHSHGVRLDNKFDGVVDLSQKPIKVGETFSYTLKFPDEGVYWYHPHIREDYAQESGLYGNYLVTSNNLDYWSPVNREVPLMIDDILIENGQLAPFNKSFANRTLMGRFGNRMLINGEDNYNLQVKKGEVVRFFMTNAANTRTFNISIPNAKMKLVGADNGKYEREEFTDSVILGPSERSIVEVLFDNPGTYTINHTTPEKVYTMGKITVDNQTTDTSYSDSFSQLRTNQDTTASMASFKPYFDKKVDKNLILSLDMGSMNNTGTGKSSDTSGNTMNHQMGNDGAMSMSGESDSTTTGMSQQQSASQVQPIEWEDTMGDMNTSSTSDKMKWKMKDQDTGKENMDIDWKFKIGDKVKVKITNDANGEHPMQHPIHFHGQRFLVLTTNGVKNTNLVWKDTVLIKTGDTVEILIDASNPGTWMAHCHISEHLESNMMLKYQVL